MIPDARFRALSHRSLLIGTVVTIALVALGSAHAFRHHGRTQGVLAAVLPPVGLFRAAEGVWHWQTIHRRHEEGPVLEQADSIRTVIEALTAAYMAVSGSGKDAHTVDIPIIYGAVT